MSVKYIQKLSLYDFQKYRKEVWQQICQLGPKHLSTEMGFPKNVDYHKTPVDVFCNHNEDDSPVTKFFLPTNESGYFSGNGSGTMSHYDYHIQPGLSEHNSITDFASGANSYEAENRPSMVPRLEINQSHRVYPLGETCPSNSTDLLNYDEPVPSDELFTQIVPYFREQNKLQNIARDISLPSEQNFQLTMEQIVQYVRIEKDMELWDKFLASLIRHGCCRPSELVKLAERLQTGRH